MTANIGNPDRAFRLFAAIVLVVLVFMSNLSTTLEVVLLIVAATLAVTSVLRVCPLYRLLGVSTCPLN